MEKMGSWLATAAQAKVRWGADHAFYPHFQPPEGEFPWTVADSGVCK